MHSTGELLENVLTVGQISFVYVPPQQTLCILNNQTAPMQEESMPPCIARQEQQLQSTEIDNGDHARDKELHSCGIYKLELARRPHLDLPRAMLPSSQVRVGAGIGRPPAPAAPAAPAATPPATAPPPTAPPPIAPPPIAPPPTTPLLVNPPTPDTPLANPPLSTTVVVPTAVGPATGTGMYCGTLTGTGTGKNFLCT